MIWILSGALFVVAGYLLVLNWICVIQGLRGKSTSSWIPLLGGGLGAIGCWVAPDDTLTRWWWVPLVIDFGSAPGLLFTAVYPLFRRSE
jgi:hypothetical protein